MDGSPRPCKRRKLELSKPITDIRPLPPAVLLLSLQSFLAHPPTHRNYTCSLFLTLFALRKCLSLSGLDYFTECRAWTSLAEVGFRIGLGEPGIVGEVEKAITKAVCSQYSTRLSSAHAVHSYLLLTEYVEFL